MFFMVFAAISASAQTMQEVVYLKNGSVVRGIIIEQIPNVSLKIRTADGSIFAYEMADVDKITKEPSLSSLGGANGRYGKGPARGYRGFVDLGYSVGVGELGEDRLDFTTSHGYQFNPYIFAGVGAGVDYFPDSYSVSVPVFAHARSEFLKGQVSPFLDVKVGYAFVDTKGFYCNPSFGCRIGIGGGCGVSFGIGYAMQYIDMGEDELCDYAPRNCGGFSIKLGVDF